MAKKSNPKKSTAPVRKGAAPAAKKVSKPAAKIVAKHAAKLAKPAARAAVKAKPAPKAPRKFIKSPLSKPELDEFRKMLLDKRRAILGDMTSIESDALRVNRQDGSGDLSNMPTHPADIGSDNFEQEFTLGLLESERTLLSEINAALERIDAGSFGVCLGTGGPIGVARLRARPWAKYCIEYAKMLEKGLVSAEDERRNESGDEEEEEGVAAVEGAESEEAEEAEDEDDFVEEDVEE